LAVNERVSALSVLDSHSNLLLCHLDARHYQHEYCIQHAKQRNDPSTSDCKGKMVNSVKMQRHKVQHMEQRILLLARPSQVLSRGDLDSEAEAHTAILSVIFVIQDTT